MRGHAIGICTAVALGATLLAAPAGAAVDCDYSDVADTLTVTSDAGAADPTDVALIGRDAGGTIIVQTLAGAVACTGAGGPATVNNIGNLNLTGGAGSVFYGIIDPASFGPGNGGSGEIEVLVTPGGGDDQFEVLGTPGNDFFVLGAAGMNWSGDQDVDATFIGVENIGVSANAGEDAVTARGADGTGAPFAGPAQFLGSGNDGNDVVEGGDAGDLLTGGDGNDTLRGFAGPDELSGDEGTNLLDGGADADTADYLGGNGVNVDLAIAGPQGTGFGTDTLASIENLSGSNLSDTLHGDGGANVIRGQDADDVINGRAGNDQLEGGAGVNTVTYGEAPSGVNVDLTAGTATGGAGSDALNSFSILIGSPFADSLLGNEQNNSIIALGGEDTVSALAGADVVDVRDGGPDTASCGTEIDNATADRAIVDSVDPDCENVAFLPEPEPDPGGGDPPPTEDRELAFDLVGKSKQRVLEREGVIVRALCPLEDCTATVSARGKVPKPRRKLNLRPVTEAVGAGVAEKIKLRLRKRQRRAIAAALRAGKKPRITVTASVTDAAGNAASDTLTVRTKR